MDQMQTTNYNLREILSNAKQKFINEQYQQLIIADEWAYPPVQKHVKEIYVSQFVTAFTNQYVQNTTQEKVDKKGKFPIPLIFAIAQSNIKKQKYAFAIKIMQSHVDKMNTQNCHILSYNIAKIYEKLQNWQKNIFNLQSVLRQQPFCGEAVHDLSLSYAYKQNRTKQAIQLLERHLKSTKIINLGYVHSAYIHISHKMHRNSKEIMKNLNNQQLSLTNYFNLGLMLKLNQQYLKSLQIFIQIWTKLNQYKLSEHNSWSQKDEKLMILTKINIFKILQVISEMNKDLSKPLQSMPKAIIDAHKAQLKIWDIKALQKRQTVTDLMTEQEIISFLSAYISSKSKTTKNTKHFAFNKGEKQNSQKNKIQQDYSDVREYNDKKLKYLLIKQKEINNFFRNLVVRKENGTEKYKFLYQGQQKTIDMSDSQSLMRRAKAFLKNQEFQHFQKQFQQKRKVHQFKYNNLQVQKIISEVISNLNQCKNDKKSQDNQASINKYASQPKKNKTSHRPRFVKHNFRTSHSPQLKNTERILNPLITEKRFQKQLIKQKIQKKVKKQTNIEKIQNNLCKKQTKVLRVQQKNQTKIHVQKTKIHSQKETNHNKSCKKIENKVGFQKIQHKTQNQLNVQRVLLKNSSQVKIKLLEQKIQTQLVKNTSQPKSLHNFPPILRSVKFIDSVVEKPQVKTKEMENFKQFEEKPVASVKKMSEKKVVSIKKIQATKPQTQKQHQTEKQLIKQQQKYDPMMSSFQLTGFRKSSLAAIMQNKASFKKIKNQPQSSQHTSKKLVSSKQTSPLVSGNLNSDKAYFELQLQQGLNLQKQSRYQQSYEKYTAMYKIYKKQQQKQQILLGIARSFQHQQRMQEAQKTYLKCTKYNNVKAFFGLGSLLMRIGRIKSGVQNMQKANCIKRDDLQIENKLVYGYSLSQDTIEKALMLAHTILKKQPQSLETLIMTANILEKQGKIKQAIDIVTAVDNVKEAEYIKHYLGLLYLSNSNFTQAFNYFKAALAIKPDHVPSLIQIATIISDISPKQSIAILDKVREIDPYNRKALARLGKIYESIENDFQKAMMIYRSALESQQNYESYMKIGDCYFKKESYIEALLNYKEALKLKKTHQVLAKIGKMLEKKNQYVKAIQNYQSAIQLLHKQKDYQRQTYDQYLMSLGKVQALAFNYDQAIRCFQQIMQQNQTVELNKLIAQAYFGKKDYKVALSYYQKANNLSGGSNSDILQNMAICFDKMQEYLASKAIYQKILAKQPNNIKCMNNMANILLITGQTNEAFYLFENMLEKIPKNIQKRLKVADIYAQVGDWSKVEYHLLHCLKIKEHDSRVLQKLIVLYKEKRENRLVDKYEKKLNLLKAHNKQKV